MAEPRGHTLFTDTLRVINRAVEAHAHASPWREIITRTGDHHREPRTFGVDVYEDDPERPVDHYRIGVHEGRFEVIERGSSGAAVDWRVSVDQLRGIIADPDAHEDAPEKLGLSWLVERLGIGQQPRSRVWSPRRGRPKRH